jgi:methylated-DNA-[protein]-cysteine S-methyltransferase
MAETHFSTGKQDFLFFACVWGKGPGIDQFYISARNNLADQVHADFPAAQETVYPDMNKLEKLLYAWLNHKIAALPLTMLNLARLSKFQRKVLDELRRRTNCGQTISYGDLANCAGCPRGAQAVGQVMRHNPFPLFYPCHRVIKSGGAIGNFSAGPELKIKLLARGL